jgi:hypothetical protein
VLLHDILQARELQDVRVGVILGRQLAEHLECILSADILPKHLANTDELGDADEPPTCLCEHALEEVVPVQVHLLGLQVPFDQADHRST